MLLFTIMDIVSQSNIALNPALKIKAIFDPMEWYFPFTSDKVS